MAVIRLESHKLRLKPKTAYLRQAFQVFERPLAYQDNQLLINRLNKLGISFQDGWLIIQGEESEKIKQWFNEILKQARHQSHLDRQEKPFYFWVLEILRGGGLNHIEQQLHKTAQLLPPTPKVTTGSLATKKSGIARSVFEKSSPLRKAAKSISNQREQPIPPTTVQKPVAAVWQDRPVETPWCPQSFLPYLEYLHYFEYQDDQSRIQSVGWRILAATRRGRRHAHDGRHREDAWAYERVGDSIIACVSDGAGSAAYSRIGSETACRRVTEILAYLLRHPPSPEPGDWLTVGLQYAIQETRDYLVTLATQAGESPKTLRCTLLVAVLYRYAGSETFITGQIGDGCIVGLAKDRSLYLSPASNDDSSGFYSGEVQAFLPDENALAYLRIHSIPLPLQCLILCTDGIDDPFYPMEKKGYALFKQLYEGVQQSLPGFDEQIRHGPILTAPDETAQHRLEQWLSFQKRGENDDRTMMLLHRLDS